MKNGIYAFYEHNPNSESHQFIKTAEFEINDQKVRYLFGDIRHLRNIIPEGGLSKDAVSKIKMINRCGYYLIAPIEMSTKDDWKKGYSKKIETPTFFNKPDHEDLVEMLKQHLLNNEILVYHPKKGFVYHEKWSSWPKINKAELDKSRGRITFPADPKITNRPDQQIKPVSSSDMTNEDRIKSISGTMAGSLKNPMARRDVKDAISDHLSSPQFRGGTVQSDPPKAYVKNANERVAEHEGAHFLFTSIKNKHGKDTYREFVDHLLGHVDDDVKGKLVSYLSDNPEYSRLLRGGLTDLYTFKEEVLARLRDSLVNEKVNRNGQVVMPAGETRYNFFHNYLQDHEKRDYDNKAKSSWSKVIQAAKDFQLPTKKNEEEFNQELSDFISTDIACEFLEKSENKVQLVHYSRIPNLKTLDPSHMGTGTGGAEMKHGVPDIKSVYYYRKGSKPEQIVTQGAKSLYHVDLDPQQHKLYDLGTDTEDHVKMALRSNNNIWDRDKVLGYIRDKGYSGFYNSESALPHAVALFHPHDIKSEEFIK